jgi:hypothetical protein
MWISLSSIKALDDLGIGGKLGVQGTGGHFHSPRIFSFESIYSI